MQHIPYHHASDDCQRSVGVLPAVYHHCLSPLASSASVFPIPRLPPCSASPSPSSASLLLLFFFLLLLLHLQHHNYHSTRWTSLASQSSHHQHNQQHHYNHLLLAAPVHHLQKILTNCTMSQHPDACLVLFAPCPAASPHWHPQHYHDHQHSSNHSPSS